MTWQAVFGLAVSVAVLVTYSAFILTEFIGGRIPGFTTVSRAAQEGVARGDYRIFVLVMLAFCLGPIYWLIHVLYGKAFE